MGRGLFLVTMDDPVRFGVAALAAVAFGVGASRLGALSRSGAVAGGVFGWELIALGGWAWAGPALAFFVLSSAWSRVGRASRLEAERLAEKGGRRDAGQVLANGGAAMALLAAYAVWPVEALYAAFVGSLAAAAADTWGTEVGTLVGGPTRRLGVGARVPPGTSGGMSAAGTLGALAGAASVVLPAVGLGGLGAPVALGLVAVGLGASTLDTALGATVQARYRRADGALTERREEDGTPLPLAAGWRGVGNDAVNWACTLAGAAGGAAVWAGVG